MYSAASGVVLTLVVLCPGCKRAQTDALPVNPPPPRLKADAVKVGMDRQAVVILLGVPHEVIHEEDTGLEGWRYYQHEGNLVRGGGEQLFGLTVVFDDKAVIRVWPTIVNRW